MNAFSEPMALWLADYLLLSTLLLAVVLALCLRIGQPARRLAIARPTLAALFLLGGLCVLPGWSLVHLMTADGTAKQQASGNLVIAPPIESPSTQLFATPNLEPSTSIPAPTPAATALAPAGNRFSWTSWLVGTYLLGSLLVIAWQASGGVLARRLIRQASPAPPELLTLLAESGETGKRLPTLLVSDRIQTPAALGVLRPKILLPARWIRPPLRSAGEGLGEGQLRPILAHELAHVRHGDLATLAAVRGLMILLWPQPLYWLLRRQVRRDQESLADAAAAEVTGRADYAEQLVAWARAASGAKTPRLASSVGLWESASQLKERVAMLLDEKLTVLRTCSRSWQIGSAISLMIIAMGLSLVTLTPAETLVAEAGAEDNTADEQPMGRFSARVLDPDGEPVRGAEVIPWALRSSQGHGRWLAGDSGDSGPPTLVTDAHGRVEVPYPVFRYWAERVATTEVTLSIDHPEYPYISHEYVDIPRENSEPHEVHLHQGVALEVTPLVNGQPAALESIHALRSDGRAWHKASSTHAREAGALRIPSLTLGKAQLMLVRLRDETATHFSSLMRMNLTEPEIVRQTIELHPAIEVRGRLSDNIPRPVKQGRVKVRTVPAGEDDLRHEVTWFTWAPVAEDGTFVVSAWPTDQPMQLIALCEGYIATSGERPWMVRPERARESYQRPQVFLTPQDPDSVLVEMTLMVRCEIETVDSRGRPLAGIEVRSYPNVGWWNDGSQIYCAPLVRGEKLLLRQDYFAAIDNEFSPPFVRTTDDAGRATLELPSGEQHFYAASDDFELPIILGRRQRKVELVAGESTTVRLVMQPTGTEQLGEWDSLAGYVFGCTDEHCQLIIQEQPQFQKRFENLAQRLESAANPRNPKILHEAFSTIAEGLEAVGENTEAAKMRKKADEQAERMESDDVNEQTSPDEEAAEEDTPLDVIIPATPPAETEEK